MELTSYRVEYLITVEQKDTFCKSVDAFKNLLTSIDGVSLTKNELKFESLVLSYEIQTGEISKDKQRYFHLKLSCHNENQLDGFESLLKSIRVLLNKAGGKPPQTLWDGLSFGYAQMAYPLMHEIENTMRKLITKFMLINVGLGWTKETIPNEVAESVRSKSANLDNNYLYEVDFIQLSNFLFKEYATLNSIELIDKLSKAELITELDLHELKNAIPKSNWDRYFSSIVQCDSEYLKLRWARLYERRNQIAHNRPISRFDYEDIHNLYNELNPKIQQAIEHLDQVVISEDDKEAVSENAAVSKSLGVSEFLEAWSIFHQHLFMAASTTNVSGGEKKLSQLRNNIRGLLNIIKDAGLISKEQKDDMADLLHIRNIIVHHPELVVPEDALPVFVRELIDHIVELKVIIEKNEMIKA